MCTQDTALGREIEKGELQKKRELIRKQAETHELNSYKERGGARTRGPGSENKQHSKSMLKALRSEIK